ncbi:MAG: homocysteine S-methyltransferase family protein [Hyphomonadaceae bacterium]|nr:homocysteine S-methyltransferase family protein [Hyphomonadaceae bacterium]
MIDQFFAGAGRFALTDGGIETTLIYDDGLDLPHFAAFPLAVTDAGRAVLTRYYERHIAIAKREGVGFVLESPTWRANPDWADALGYSKTALAAANRAAMDLMHTLRAADQSAATPMLVSGCVGPRGDGYAPGVLMRAETAQAYHDEQIAVLAQAGADIISAITMTNAPEAIGVARAAKRHGKPCVVSFTVETDGRLPTGQTLADAIAEVDAAGAQPVYFMINCAHPTHFLDALQTDAPWLHRIGGVRANASCKSHDDRNAATALDRGDPAELGALYRRLRHALPRLKVLGGCCGTDHTHIAAIAEACR